MLVMSAILRSFFTKVRRFFRVCTQLTVQCPLAATSEHSMHFGHGRYACPRRYMATDEVKLVVVWFLSSYDIVLFGPRPPNMKLLKFNVPNMKAKIWLRRRQVSEDANK